MELTSRRFGRYKGCITLYRGAVNCRATSGGWILAHCSTCSIEQYLLKYIFFHFSGLPLFCADPTLSLEASTWKVSFSISQNGDMLNWHSKKMTIIWEQFISCSYRLSNAHFHATYRCVCISLFCYWEKTYLYSFNTSNPWLEFLVGQIMLKKEILEFLPVPWDYSSRQTLLQPWSYQRKAKSPH